MICQASKIKFKLMPNKYHAKKPQKDSPCLFGEEIIFYLKLAVFR